jgi:hypothetical protein
MAGVTAAPICFPAAMTAGGICVCAPDGETKLEFLLNIDNKINRCRPGFGASCSFCCGSHNYTLSPEKIEKMFIERDAKTDSRGFGNPEEACGERLVRDGIQCPNVGISISEPGIVCCLTYDDDHEGCGFKSFFSGTCRSFFCAAWYDLSDRQVAFAAELMKDWYYYSLLIMSTETLAALCADYESPRNVPADVLESLKCDLPGQLQDTDLL